MPLVAHLVGHDLRTHRVEVTVWLLLLVAHVPLGAAIAAGTLPVHPEVATPTLLLVRLVLAAITIASILQADAPSDHRTFWRTRPVPRAGMAVAKVGLIAALFLGAPLAVVLLEAMWLRVPLSHLPTILLDVIAQDGALVGLMVLVATLTRRVASMVLALVATGIGLFLLMTIAGAVLRTPQARAYYAGAPQHAEQILPMLGVLLAATTFVMSLDGWRRTARPRSLATIAAAGLAVAVVALAFPSLHARSERGRTAAGRAEVVGRALVVVPAAREVLISAPVLLDHVSFNAGGSLRLVDGVLEVDGRRYVLSDRTQDVVARPPMLLLTTLSREAYADIAGRRGRLSGTVHGDVAQPDLMGRLPLRRGASLEVDGLRLQVLATRTVEDPGLGRLAVTWTHRRLADFTPSRTRLLRSTSARDAAAVHVTWSLVSAVDTAMLPTIARPFGYRTVILDDWRTADAPRPDDVLEVVRPSRYARGTWQLDSEVTLPASDDAVRSPR